jgi:flagellar hook assembly protein FlgD
MRKNTFYFRVYDKRGEVVFYTKNVKGLECSINKNNGWDGTHNKSGKELPIGNYVYEVYFQDFEGWKHHDFGFLRLIR